MDSSDERPYTPRVVDAQLGELAASLPAASIEGPRAVGKTETALRHARTVHRLDDQQQLQIVRGDPARLVRGEPPVLIDEWQRYPASWDLVRRRVDESPQTARFLLTGSARPSEKPTHSGAGRFVTMRMRPMSLAERRPVEPAVSLGALLGGTRPALGGATDMKLADYAAEIARSGFPGIRNFNPKARIELLDGYLDRVVDYDIDDVGAGPRDRDALRLWLTAYAAATSTNAAYRLIRAAATGGSGEPPSAPTAASYRRALEQLWLLDELPAWLPTRNRLRRLASGPKHHLADPALALRCLGVDEAGLIEGEPAQSPVARDGTLLGAIFESLVAQSVRVYAQANGARVSHLRTHGGEHEVDLIVERGDGRVVALEVKLSATVDQRDVRHLRWLADRLGDDLMDAAVVTTGTEAYRRQDGIGVIPAALLAP